MSTGFPSPRKQLFVLAVLAFSAYAPTLRLGFFWDDHVIIENNAALHQWSWETLWNDFTTDNTRGTGDNYYRPLQAVSHRIDYTLWGLNPFGYHLTNLLFHVGNAWLLRYLGLALGLSPLASLMAASLFAVHPIGVEQFIIPSGRGTPISLFFVLCSLCLLLRQTRRATGGAMVCYLTALFFKEYSLVLPLFFGLTQWYLRKPVRPWIWIGLGLLSAIYLTARWLVVGEVAGHVPWLLNAKFIAWAFPRTVWNYLLLMLIPWNLHSHRLIPHLSPWWPLWFVGFLAITIAALRWRDRRLGLCWGWLLAGLAPTIPQMARGGFMLDHWGYGTLPAVLWPLSWGWSFIWSHARRWISLGVGALYFVLLIVWALLVHLNVELRGTDEKMYRWALNFTTSTPIHYNLGVLLLSTGRPLEALEHFELVRRMTPEDLNNRHALATAYWRAGYQAAAYKMIVDITRSHPEYLPAHQTLATMQAQRGHRALSPAKSNT